MNIFLIYEWKQYLSTNIIFSVFLEGIIIINLVSRIRRVDHVGRVNLNVLKVDYVKTAALLVTDGATAGSSTSRIQNGCVMVKTYAKRHVHVLIKYMIKNEFWFCLI